MDYRDYLKRVLEERIKRNKSYSLRAFARDLSLSPSYLSCIFSGSRQLSEEKGSDISEVLGLSIKEREYLLTLLRLDRTKSGVIKKELLTRLNEMRPSHEKMHHFTVDQFVYISEWQHFAILSLFRMKSMTITPSAVSKQLGITVIEAEMSLNRLSRLKLISRNSDGSYKRLAARLYISSDRNHEALKKYHTQMLEKTIAALKYQSPDERITKTENIVVSEESLPAINAICNEAFQKIKALENKDSQGTHVYHAGIHIFRLTKNKSKKITKGKPHE